jgi:hypothetical protein
MAHCMWGKQGRSTARFMYEIVSDTQAIRRSVGGFRPGPGYVTLMLDFWSSIPIRVVWRFFWLKTEWRICHE